MDRAKQVSLIVSETILLFQKVIDQFIWDGKVYFKVVIGSEGMGPEISFFFLGSQFDETLPDVEVQFWLSSTDDVSAVMIYSAFTPKTEEIDHFSHDLGAIKEAQQFFEKAMILFEVSKKT